MGIPLTRYLATCGAARYLVDVEGDPIVAESAHKHEIGDDDILHAYNNPIRVEELDEELFMLIGADRAGNLLEIGVVAGAEGPVIVHAMEARPKYLG
jgi:hypothetical protein